jgi:ATP-dependent exoDNAse (exonuclease V) beta subunit
VVTELAECCAEERRERDVPPPRNQGLLSVLTLHGSKGLEFPHVILIDLGKKPKSPDAPLLFWDRVQGVYLASRDEDGQRDKRNPLEASWRETEKRKNLAESKRVFYVALTRARERLVLVCPEVEGYELPEPEKAFAEDDWRSWVECAGVEPVRLEVPVGKGARDVGISSPSGRVRATPLAVSRLLRPRHSVTEWNLLARCERAYEWTYVRPIPPQAEEGLFASFKRVSQEEQELSSRELGTRVHACLERADFEGLRALEREVGPERFAAEPVIEWAGSSPWMKSSDREQGREVWTELAFEVPVTLTFSGAPEVLVGSLDRLVVDQVEGRPRHTIIDFKITEKPKSAEELEDAYGTQMELYAAGLKRLDPDAQPRSAVLVNISAGAVHEVEVPVGRLSAESMASRASRIVSGEKGKAAACELCRYCDFRSRCEVGRRVR